MHRPIHEIKGMLSDHLNGAVICIAICNVQHNSQ